MYRMNHIDCEECYSFEKRYIFKIMNMTNYPKISKDFLSKLSEKRV